MKEIVERIRGLQVLVIGDVMLDHYMWGDATRISPEAPVPVVEVLRDTYAAGGAANVAVNLRAMGGDPDLCGRIGNDEPGRILLDLLDRGGVRFDRERLCSDRPTIEKTRVMVQRQQLCRLDREGPPHGYRFTRDADLRALAAKVNQAQAVIVADYAKGLMSDDTLAAVRDVAGKRGIPVAVDPKPRGRLTCREVDLITPNRTEALELAGLRLARGELFPAEEVCRRIWDRFTPRYLVVTLGEEGMLLSERGRITARIPTVAREVFDVSGAGDTVVAALTLALGAGFPLREAAHFANAAAGVVVGKVGTATATPEEILSCHAQT